MKMVPHTAHIADGLPLLHLLAECDIDAGTIGVQRIKRSVMLYLDIVPIASAPRVGRVCNCHRAARCRKNRRTIRRGDIRAAVVGYFARKRVGVVSKLRGDGKTLRQRLCENVRAYPIGITANDTAAMGKAPQQRRPHNAVFLMPQQHQMLVLLFGKAIGRGHLFRRRVVQIDRQRCFFYLLHLDCLIAVPVLCK